MRLTGFAKAFITIVILAVVGYAAWHYKGHDRRKWATGSDKTTTATGTADNSADFNALKNAPADPGRDAGSNGVQPVGLTGTGRLNRPLVVAINTWAGHSPGIVYNDGLEAGPNSMYRKRFNMDVKFVLIEDPAAKLAAFRKGDVDIMWNTVDNWAREASILAENNQRAKSIIMQDWSRGGDGIVSLASINSIEQLKGHKIACTQFTPSHFLLLYLLSQSGLNSQDRADVEKNVIFTQDAPAAAAMFKAKQVDAAGSYAIVGKALKLDTDTVSGMLSGLKLTPYADNAQFYGLGGGKGHYETLFDTAFVIWRKKGLVTRSVSAKDWADTRFLSALASDYGTQKVEEPKMAAKAPAKTDRASINKQIEIHFTPGSDEIMPGSFFVLDSLGDTMTSFGSTYLRVEGNTDATGSANKNLTLSERRALAVKNYILKSFPNIEPARFQTIGHGAANPVADNTTEAGRQPNRRTDIKPVLATE